MADRAALTDLVTFARWEQAAGDIEPWAATIGALHTGGTLNAEAAAWLVALYNTYDDIGSAWRIHTLWPDPRTPAPPAARTLAVQLPISGERRNLYGGRILKRFDSYVSYLDGRDQLGWLRHGLVGLDPVSNFVPLTRHLRRIWGVGRLAAFEWAEFLHKVNGVPVDAPHAQLWESSGPRESIQRLYGPPPRGPVTADWLNECAVQCKATLAAAGVGLSWWDFETVICDFNVMRKGRYYVGQHIAMIRAEIDGLDEPARTVLGDALGAAVPAPWHTLPPGVDKTARPVYRNTGRITLPFGTTVGGT